MRILVLGGTGMAGHKMVQVLSEKHHVTATVRSDMDVQWLQGLEGLITPAHDSNAQVEECDEEMCPTSSARPRVTYVTPFDACDQQQVRDVVRAVRPELIINCIGITDKVISPGDRARAITLNATLPHTLADAGSSVGAHVILVSTDCVFDGTRGKYSETDNPTSSDLYGRSKALGEVSDQPHVLTIRTSIIGRQLRGQRGLVEWFLNQARDARIKGFTTALYSGVTTVRLARILESLLDNVPLSNLHGLVQVVSEPINKYDLLTQLQQHWGSKDHIHTIGIAPSADWHIDRTMTGEYARAHFNLEPVPWSEMWVEFMEDSGPQSGYEAWRTQGHRIGNRY